MTIQYECTPEEISRAQSAIFRAGYNAANSKLKYWAIMLALLGLTGYRFYDEIIRTGQWGWVGVFVVIWLIALLILRNKSQRQQNSHKITTVTMSDDGLHFATANSNALIPWGDFSNSIDTPEFVLLKRRSGSSWHYIPTRAFNCAEFLEQFRTETRDRIEFFGRVALVKIMSPVAGLGDRQLSFTHNYLDCVDLTVASWITRGLLVLLAGGIASGIYKAETDDGAHVSWKAYVLLGTVCFSFICTICIIVQSWKLHSVYKKRKQPEWITIGPEGLSVSNGAGCESIDWNRLTHFKEGFRTFILWEKGLPLWLSIPKRACGDQSGVDAVRKTLSEKLRRSTWFMR